MTIESAKRLAHELAIEYIRCNPEIFNDVASNIPNMVDKFAIINEKFYDSIANHRTLSRLY